MKASILLLPVKASVRKVVAAAASICGRSARYGHQSIFAKPKSAARLATGASPLPEETLAAARAANAILLAPSAILTSTETTPHAGPETALLSYAASVVAYANLRPAKLCRD